MVIETLEKKLTVLRYLSADEHIERYVCQDEKDQEVYLVVRIREKDWIVKTLGFLTEQVGNKEFTDMVNCFFSEDCLFVVMRYVDERTVKDKFESQDCALSERIAIGRSILDQLVLQQMPDYFMKDCLDVSGIRIDQTLKVDFLYSFSGLYDYDRVTFKDVTERIADIMKLIFEPELKKKTLSKVEDFIEKLKEGEYVDLLTVYREYDEICKSIAGMTEEELVEPQTRIFKIWASIKRGWPVVKRIIAIALIMAALIFLVITIVNSGKSGEEEKIFTYIGTLTIK